MRTGPVALAHLGQDDAIAQAARSISDLTHRDPTAGDACVLWSIAIDRAVREGRLDGAPEAVELLPPERRTLWTELLDEAESSPPSRFAPNGHVVKAFQAAHAAVYQTPIPGEQPCRHLKNALAAAIYVGDDTDTVAAIAGALLGARWGASAVPLEWRAGLHGWPGYRVADLNRLAMLSVRHGEPDESGWPVAGHLADYYAKQFGSDAVEAALPDDPGVTVGTVSALARLDTTPDVVVSLCRTGPKDGPAGSEVHNIWLIDDPSPTANPNLDFILTDLTERIVAWRAAGRTVFIHCVQAESRTPTVAAAYLAGRRGLSGREALERVRSVLPGAHPNSAFTAALDRLWPEPSGRSASA
jgi:hypothetical protein